MQLFALGLDLLGFFVKRLAIINLWEPPPAKTVFSPVFIKVLSYKKCSERRSQKSIPAQTRQLILQISNDKA